MVDAAVVDNYPWDNLIGSQRELFVGARGVVSYQQFFQLVDEKINGQTMEYVVQYNSFYFQKK